MNTRLLQFLVLLTFSAALVRGAESSPLGTLGLASLIEKKINTIAKFTATTVLPGKGKKEGSIGLTVISEKPVFAVEKSKFTWLIVAVGSIGFVLNEHPEIDAEEAWFMDMSMAKEGRALALPCHLIKDLQAKSKANQISADEMYAAILKNLTAKKTKS
jgi:hypothetical protein